MPSIEAMAFPGRPEVNRLLKQRNHGHQQDKVGQQLHKLRQLSLDQ